MDSKKLVIIVAGMHRSGTSALTRVINLLGIGLPEDLVPGFAGNELGHWEPEAVVTIHDAMLRAAGSDVNDVVGFDPAWLASPEAGEGRARIRAFLEETLAATPAVVLKDPRICLVLPVWIEVLRELGIRTAFIIPYRDPAEVAMSLARRQAHFFPDSVWPPERGGLLWLRYVTEAERWTRGLPRAFVAYDDLLADWRSATGRIGEQLGLDWPEAGPGSAARIDAFLSSQHKHESARDGRALRELDAACRALDGLQADPAGTLDLDPLETGRLRGAYLGAYVAALEAKLEASGAAEAARAAPAGQVPEPDEILRIGGGFAFEGLSRAALASGTGEAAPAETLAGSLLRRHLCGGDEGLEGETEAGEAADPAVLAEALRRASHALRVTLAEQAEAAAQARAEAEAARAEAAAAHAAGEAQADAARAETEAARAALEGRFDAEIAALRDDLRAETERRIGLEARLADRDARLAALRGFKRARLGRERRTVLRVAGLALTRAKAPETRLRARMELVRGSGLFDEAWYLERHADVEGTEMDPLQHFVRHGSAEGRSPGPAFDAGRYLTENPDVAPSGLEPLFHYLAHGRAEGRPIFAVR
ncbi:sulfotransferase family protein [Methylobacterium sp. A54F]